MMTLAPRTPRVGADTPQPQNARTPEAHTTAAPSLTPPSAAVDPTLVRAAEQGKVACARAVCALMKQGPEGASAVLKALNSTDESLPPFLKVCAAAQLYKYDSYGFLRWLDQTPPDSNARQYGVRALGSRLTVQGFDTLIAGVKSEHAALTLTSLHTLHHMLVEKGMEIPWSLKRYEGLQHLMRFAADTGIGSPQAGSNNPSIMGAVSKTKSNDAVGGSSYQGEIRSTLISVARELSRGLDMALSAFVRAGKTIEECAIPFALLKERRGPEFEAAQAEIQKRLLLDDSFAQLLT